MFNAQHVFHVMVKAVKIDIREQLACKCAYWQSNAREPALIYNFVYEPQHILVANCAPYYVF
ncbi:hypothetical protein SDC9_208705 [bioreactor metagenome]|uniref:Uncharacterized protein n=1 Tax=bioreactor metagenome TaxID=1076179 RepID=A0A645JCS9_9ZZZZ